MLIRYLLTIICLLTIDAGIFAQPCPGTDQGRTSQGSITERALFISDNNRALSFCKVTDSKNKAATPRYYVAFNSMPEHLLPDSLINTEGALELRLANGHNVLLQRAVAKVNPFGSNTPLGFSLEIDPEQLNAINAPVARVMAFGRLSATFSGPEQQRMWELISCFKDKDPRR